jgi:hypothetical protein
VEGDLKTKTGQKTSPPLTASHGTLERRNIEKVHAFVEHLAVFQQHPSENEPNEEEEIIQLLKPLPTQTTNQLSKKKCSSRSHQQPKS